MTSTDLESIELDLLLEAVFRRYGYDFRSYARASIERRASQFLSSSGCGSVAEMIPKVLHDEDFFARLLRYFSISVTAMFRDPFVYKAIRTDIVPVLKTWPNLKIWHAGCATGEEVYSLAILFREEELYDRATIYATDFNDSDLEKARTGIYSLEKIQEATRNYQKAGGKQSFGDYYHSRYEAAAMDGSLKERLMFANHNLAFDGVFGEMQMVFCRNVLIYFNRDLQNRVLALLADSLTHGGFLCIGAKENLRFSEVYEQFEPVNEKARIYKKKVGGKG